MIGVLQRVRVARASDVRQACLSFLLAFAFLLALAGASQANPRYAAIVYDVNAGQVLFSRNADAQRFPASITKVMTVYILLEEVEAGRLSLDSQLRVSARAANEPPSKVGVRAGSTISVRDAIGVLITRSANDVATVVAENVSGDVDSFAQRMTRTARAIGMNNTTFRNAHGLPNSGQVTTARDIVTLALAVQRRFPQYYHFFGMRSYTYAGTTYRNHNRLLGQMAGVDGLKTGFIRASGFNLVANIRRDGRHLIGVVMGGRTGATRDAHMREILADALPRARRGADIRIADAPLPRARPTSAGASLSPAAQMAKSILVPSTVVPATLVSASAGRPYPLPEHTLGMLPAGQEEAGSSDPQTAGATTPARRNGDWAIQIGAVASEGMARQMLERARGDAPDILDGTAPYTESVQSNGQTLWRARFAGFDRHEAEAACAALERRQYGCFALRN